MSRGGVAVLVLGYRSRPDLEAGVLDSVRRAAGAIQDRPVHLVFLDNYSRDGTIQWMERHATDFDLLLSPRNQLYCGGVNTLLQYAARRYAPELHILVDADNPADAAAYAALVEFMDGHPQHGIAQPLVRSRADPERLYSCGHRYTADGWCRPLTKLPEDPSELLDLRSCSISSTIVRARMLQETGLLDPRYEIYYESSDLCLRARARGWRCACVVGAVAYNEGSAGVGPDAMHQRYHFTRNRLLFWSLHDPAVFEEVAGEARARLATLNRAQAELAWGLGPTEEAERQGLEDGLRLAGAAAPASLPSLDGWRNGSAVLLHSAERASGAEHAVTARV